MQNIREIGEDTYYIGCSDRCLSLFESAYPIPNGISYNSYLILDTKTVLFDTVDKACASQFFENLNAGLKGRKLDYIVVQHMEPDHCALLEEVTKCHPEAKIVCTAKSVNLIKQFFNFDIDTKAQIVKDGDFLNTGKHEFTFLTAPMVHWPEVMVTYDNLDKTLYSADAFGSFGAINGNIYDNEIDFNDYINEARRYYSNIVGKYGTQVQMLLKKIVPLKIKSINPLHGLIIKENLDGFINKYDLWSKYEPELKSILIAYSSVYGGTANTAEILAAKLADRGVKNIKMYDVSQTHHSYIISDIFKYSHIVFATTTYNNGIFETMENLLHNVASHCIKNKKFILIQNGSWAPTCGNAMKTILGALKDTEIIDESICINSTLKNEQLSEIDTLTDKIILTI